MKFSLEEHPYYRGGIQCRINFDNGNGIDIINGNGAYSDDNTFEIAPLCDDELFWIESWGDQVRGYVTPEEISEIVEYAETHTKEEYAEFLNNYEFGKEKQTLGEVIDSFLISLKS